MCGIFGLVARPGEGHGPVFVGKALTTLARLSESRGKDSSGLVFRAETERELRVFKGAFALDHLLGTPEVKGELRNIFSSGDAAAPTTFTAVGHSRLVTNGSQLQEENNQPVVKGGVVGVHNGIVVNDGELWDKHPDLEREHEIDTEVMMAMVCQYLSDDGDLASAISKTVPQIFGTVTAAFLASDVNTLGLATNNGSLYTLSNGGSLFAFASEEYFLRKLGDTMGLGAEEGYNLGQVMPGQGLLVDLDSLAVDRFDFSSDRGAAARTQSPTDEFQVVVKGLTNGSAQRELVLDPALIAAAPDATVKAKLLEYNDTRIAALTRCSKCVLPETFPFIEFDGDGVCNYCRNYVIKNQPKPLDGLLEFVEPYRSKDGSPDCIVPFSGGRDSTFALHVTKDVLGLNPIAFTYDWGMVTDLARRNIARVCGKLGVENILVSADIAWKRENIRLNIEAWLKRPALGMVPLFMAGDKYFFYYTDQIKKQTGLKLNIWGINPLENTDFKVGFLGVPPDFHKEQIFALSSSRKLGVLKGVGKNFLLNPRYLNRSMIDTMGSFFVRSMVTHTDFCQLYDFFRWDEAEINELVLGEYQWEQAVDTDTTWRIGDGTAPFYNYIYCTVAGFSEFDTFRSNQIREGALTREEAMRLIEQENRPRYPSIKWYTDIVGLDFERTIKRINEIPKLYA